MSSMYFIVVIAIGSLILCMGLFMGAFHSHYKHLLDDIDESSAIIMPAAELRITLKTQLIGAINLHNKTKT